MKKDDLSLQLNSNFYACFKDSSVQEIGKLLKENGWIARKKGWEGFELQNDWSELILESSGEDILLNGAVINNEKNIKVLDDLFGSTGVGFMYEFYDSTKKLLFENKVNW